MEVPVVSPGALVNYTGSIGPLCMRVQEDGRFDFNLHELRRYGEEYGSVAVPFKWRDPTGDFKSELAKWYHAQPGLFSLRCLTLLQVRPYPHRYTNPKTNPNLNELARWNHAQLGCFTPRHLIVHHACSPNASNVCHAFALLWLQLQAVICLELVKSPTSHLQH